MAAGAGLPRVMQQRCPSRSLSGWRTVGDVVDHATGRPGEGIEELPVLAAGSPDQENVNPDLAETIEALDVEPETIVIVVLALGRRALCEQVDGVDLRSEEGSSEGIVDVSAGEAVTGGDLLPGVELEEPPARLRQLLRHL